MSNIEKGPKTTLVKACWVLNLVTEDGEEN